jgi:ABC-2 type transport system ATP-binding protein
VTLDPSRPIVIRTSALSKEFRVAVPETGPLGPLRSLVARRHTTKRAVDGISFDVGAGEIVGYIGPNGAGKSTTMKMLAGILVPTGGDVEVLGRVPWRARQDLAHHIGAVFGQRLQTWWDLPLIESLRLQRLLYALDRPRFEATLERLTDIFGLAEFMHTPVRQLSLGQRMRGELAMSLLHEPRILYLDEPTIGMDIVVKDRFRQFVKEINRQLGVTVMLTTHDMGDIERLCERVIIIDHGRLLYDGALAALRDRYGWERALVLHLDAPVSSSDLEAIEGARLADHRETTARLLFDRREISASTLITRVTSRLPVKDLALEDAPIESIVQQIYSEGAASGP